MDTLRQSRSGEPSGQGYGSIDDAVSLLSRLDPQIAVSRARELSALIVGKWKDTGAYEGAGGLIATTRGGNLGRGLMGGMMGRGMGMTGVLPKTGHGDPDALNRRG